MMILIIFLLVYLIAMTILEYRYMNKKLKLYNRNFEVSYFYLKNKLNFLIPLITLIIVIDKS